MGLVLAGMSQHGDPPTDRQTGESLSDLQSMADASLPAADMGVL